MLKQIGLFTTRTSSTLRHSYLIQNKRLLCFYEIFPKTLAKSNNDKWNLNLNQLRKEYRVLQSRSHPDLVNHSADNTVEQTQLDSSLLNQAYNTLKTPLLRAQYLIQLETGKNLNQDSEVQELKKTAISPQTLMDVMLVHEQLEDATSEAEVREMREENKIKMEEIERKLDECFNKTHDYNEAIKLSLTLKYWTNLDQAFKEWDPNRPVTLSH
ncbi:hypothetical protein ACO0QE_004658 [Hanseniaspora vineae]